MTIPLELIPALARAADIATRNDAAKGIWVGERDYVAAFLATLRNTWRLLGGEAELRMSNLTPATETLLGCDFLLVLQGVDCFKYGLFEAKWVRIPTAKGSSWDYGSRPSKSAVSRYYPPPLRAPNRISHFSDQLARQQDWLTKLASAGIPRPFVAEMFLQLTEPDAGGAPYDNAVLFDQRGSTFLWHHEARAHIAPPVRRSIPQFTPARHWSSSGGALIASAMTSTPGRTIDLLLEDVIACRQGDLVPGRVGWKKWARVLDNRREQNVLVLRGLTPPNWLDGRRSD